MTPIAHIMLVVAVCLTIYGILLNKPDALWVGLCAVAISFLL